MVRQQEAIGAGPASPCRTLDRTVVNPSNSVPGSRRCTSGPRLASFAFSPPHCQEKASLSASSSSMAVGVASQPADAQTLDLRASRRWAGRRRVPERDSSRLGFRASVRSQAFQVYRVCPMVQRSGQFDQHIGLGKARLQGRGRPLDCML